MIDSDIIGHSHMNDKVSYDSSGLIAFQWSRWDNKCCSWVSSYYQRHQYYGQVLNICDWITKSTPRYLVILGSRDKIPVKSKSWAGIRSLQIQELNLGHCLYSSFIKMRDKMLFYLVPDKLSQRIRTTCISCPRTCFLEYQDHIPILSQIKFYR